MKLIVCFKIVTCSFPFENNVNDCVKCLKSDAVVVFTLTDSRGSATAGDLSDTIKHFPQILGAGDEGFAPISLHRSTCP